jgi:hypothetical protein
MDSNVNPPIHIDLAGQVYARLKSIEPEAKIELEDLIRSVVREELTLYSFSNHEVNKEMGKPRQTKKPRKK